MLIPLIVFFLPIQSSVGFHPKESIINDEETALKWKESVEDFDSVFWSQRTRFINVLDKFLVSETSNLIGKPCLKSLKVVQKGLKERKLWSYKRE